MSLNMGGDDITEFLHVLLQRISFPYKELDLARSYDWNVVEDLKARLCTLAEVRIYEVQIQTKAEYNCSPRVTSLSTCMTSSSVDRASQPRNTVSEHMTKLSLLQWCANMCCLTEPRRSSTEWPNTTVSLRTSCNRIRPETRRYAPH